MDGGNHGAVDQMAGRNAHEAVKTRVFLQTGQLAIGFKIAAGGVVDEAVVENLHIG